MHNRDDMTCHALHFNSHLDKIAAAMAKRGHWEAAYDSDDEAVRAWGNATQLRNSETCQQFSSETCH